MQVGRDSHEAHEHQLSVVDLQLGKGIKEMCQSLSPICIPLTTLHKYGAQARVNNPRDEGLNDCRSRRSMLLR